MKLAAIFVLNALVVGAGILAYDVVRSDGAPAASPAATESADLSPVLERLEALERRLDGIGPTSDRRVSTRLLQLEQRVGAIGSDDTAPRAAAAAEALSERAAASGDVIDLASVPLDEREMVRVREALAQVEAERERERDGRRLDGLVERLGLSLTDEQRERLGVELGSFRESMRDHFRSARADGVAREDMRAGIDELRGSLTDTLGTFLSATDAEAISAEIGNRGARGPGGPGGGFGAGRGRGGN